MRERGFQAEEPGPLGQFAHRARVAKTTRDLVGAVMDAAATMVNATVSGCYLQTATSLEINQAGASDALVLRYTAFTATSVDPVHAALVERHVAVRSDDLFDRDAWMRHRFYREVAAAFGLDAYMAAQVLDGNGPRGVIGLARKAGCASFSTLDAQRLQVICLHASIALTRLSMEPEDRITVVLTRKQQDLVRFVANGYTNEQIANACNVTSHAIKKSLERLYVKTGVSSRAELVARIQVR
jgi:DNA-binding CsgD family transcriptional regulator